MDKNSIKKYAVWARRELISRVSQKALQYGISENEMIDADADTINGHLLTSKEKEQRQALIKRIKQIGYQQTMEEAAYTWFNRFSALRFMEVNGYLPTHIRVFTDEQNNFKPQILTEAIHLDMDGLNMEKVYELKDSNKTEELYKYLLITQCNALSAILPRMFTRIEDYTELLFPENLLREGSAVEQMIAMIPEDDWKDAVQIIGWLYQYYNAEPKDQVFANLKKKIKISKENIPAATQLFTPDWIVRYMVENSLGRLWIEGHPNDELKSSWKYYLDEAEQEPEVQAQLNEIRKEYASLTPEDIKVIDPAMGSGHILVYMFDVLVQIYEAYGYNAREAAGLILQNNLYGLDIDDRAAQLAYFAVMMKARQYDRRLLSRKDEQGNPDIPQPHVYEIMESGFTDKEGNRKWIISQELIDYVANGNDAIKADLEILKNELFDAKEYGSILNISQVDLSTLYSRIDEIEEDISFFTSTVQSEIRPLVEVAEILTQKYHAVVTNPPYMGDTGMNGKLGSFIRNNYPTAKYDLYASFIIKGNSMTVPYGFNSMVTMQSWLFLASFEKMRTSIIASRDITNLLYMESMVMGIAFGTAVSITRCGKINSYKGTYNEIKYDDVVNGEPYAFPIKGNHYVTTSSDNFSLLPGSPVAYWASERIYDAFKTGVPLEKIAAPRQGVKTLDNERFLKLWHEVDYTRCNFHSKNQVEATESKKKWFPYNKGGDFRRWYGNNNYLVNWENDGYEMKKLAVEKYKCVTRTITNIAFFYRPGLTWSALTQGDFSIRWFDEGFLFDSKGSSMYFDNDEERAYIMGFMNSRVASSILKILAPTMDFNVGPMKNLPVLVDEKQRDAVRELVLNCISLARQDWDIFETSWDFKCHPLIPHMTIASTGENQANEVASAILLKDLFETWENECDTRFLRLKECEETLNRIFIDVYRLQDELLPNIEDRDVTIRKAEIGRDIRSLISYAVGCMFGRYSLDNEGITYAGGEWNVSDYKTFPTDKDNIIPICDDDYFDDDITGRFVKWVETVYGKDTLEENLMFIADALGGNGTPRDAIRGYFINEFYKNHCKIYQKRPIYWLFESGKKNGFKALIYMHRYQPDTLARMRTDYVHEQQSRYHTAIADLEQQIKVASTGEHVKLSKKLQKLQDQENELRIYEEKIHHLADMMISIDLDDGVKVNYAKFEDVLAKIK